MSLVYTTLLSLVPLLAVSFAILKAFGVHNMIKPMLEVALAPLGEKSSEITMNILMFVENMKVGLLGSVGLAFLFYNIISLMQKIESSFNYTWHVAQTRSFGQRVSHYMSTILIGPILVFSAIGLSATLMDSDWMQTILAVEPLGTLAAIIAKFIPLLMIIIAFSFLYTVIPNADVNIKSAIIGASIAGVLWQSVGYLFASMVVGSTKYLSVYSALATPIFFMIWLYVGWLILLIGASVAHYHQYPERLLSRTRYLRLSPRQQRLVAFFVLSVVQKQFSQGLKGPSSLELSRRLNLPIDTLESVLEKLVKAKLLIAIVEQNSWNPAKDLHLTSAKEVVDIIDHWGESDCTHMQDWPIPEKARLWESELNDTFEQMFAQQTLEKILPCNDLHNVQNEVK